VAKIATTIAKTISNESPPDNHLRSTVENGVPTPGIHFAAKSRTLTDEKLSVYRQTGARFSCACGSKLCATRRMPGRELKAGLPQIYPVGSRRKPSSPTDPSGFHTPTSATESRLVSPSTAAGSIGHLAKFCSSQHPDDEFARRGECARYTASANPSIREAGIIE